MCGHKDEIIIFKGLNFVLENPKRSLPRLFRRLKFEISWLVKTCDHLSRQEKHQLLWDISANWMCINEETDSEMKRALRNNKNVVMRTMRENIVRPDTEMIQKWVDFKKDKRLGNPGFLTMEMINSYVDDNCLPLDQEHQVKLP